jgi:hypothetical protein
MTTLEERAAAFQALHSGEPFVIPNGIRDHGDFSGLRGAPHCATGSTNVAPTDPHVRTLRSPPPCSLHCSCPSHGPASPIHRRERESLHDSSIGIATLFLLKVDGLGDEQLRWPMTLRDQSAWSGETSGERRVRLVL